MFANWISILPHARVLSYALHDNIDNT